MFIRGEVYIIRLCDKKNLSVKEQTTVYVCKIKIIIIKKKKGM